MNSSEYAKMLEVPVNSSSVEFKPIRKKKADVKKQIINNRFIDCIFTSYMLLYISKRNALCD